MFNGLISTILFKSKFVSSSLHAIGFALSAILIVSIFQPAIAMADDWRENACSAPVSSEQILETTDFKWHFTHSEMADKFDDIYTSGKRLLHRARLSSDSTGYELLHDSSLGLRSVPITQNFIDNLTLHIEKGLALGYFDYVFFPDMGHSHLWVAQALFNEFDIPISVEQVSHFYSRALAHPDTRFLYHTAEQLKMMDDQHELLPDKKLNWRYFTRNLVGRNDSSAILDVHRNLEHIANTVCEPAINYSVWSAGFYISSSAKGCFAYKQDSETRFFDISLSYPPTPPDQLGAMVSTEGKDNTPLSSLLWGLHGCER